MIDGDDYGIQQQTGGDGSFYGSIHYSRSTLDKVKEGGIDVIRTYIFWNVHEPSPNSYIPAALCKELKPFGFRIV
ncbi:hypothetical protein AAHE18_20G159200 [Arachis hypogaea]